MGVIKIVRKVCQEEEEVAGSGVGAGNISIKPSSAVVANHWAITKYKENQCLWCNQVNWKHADEF